MYVIVVHVHQRSESIKKHIEQEYHIFWPDKTVAMTFLYLSPSYLSLLIIFSTSFWWLKNCRSFLQADAAQIPLCIGFPSILPDYLPLMELLKSRYEQNLGEAAFVEACVPIRWEHSDKNLSNTCRSCHSMHNNLCGCKRKKQGLTAGKRRVRMREKDKNESLFSW